VIREFFQRVGRLVLIVISFGAAACTTLVEPHAAPTQSSASSSARSSADFSERVTTSISVQPNGQPARVSTGSADAHDQNIPSADVPAASPPVISDSTRGEPSQTKRTAVAATEATSTPASTGDTGVSRGQEARKSGPRRGASQDAAQSDRKKSDSTRADQTENKQAGASAEASATGSADSAAGSVQRESSAPAPRLFRGNDQVIAPPSAPRGARTSADKETSLRFEQAPVREVVHAVLGDLLGVTYVLHQPIAGTVTVSTAAPVPVDQVLSLLEAVLQGNGILMAQDAAGVFHVGSADSLRGVVPVPKRTDQSPLPPGFGTVIIPLKFIGSGEMAEILRPIAQPTAFVRVDTLRNLLILAGSRNQIEGWLEIVRTFDVDLLKGMSVGVFPLQYASVRDIDDALRVTIPSIQSTPPSGAAAPGAAAPAAPTAIPRHPLLGALRIIPLERLNSILVVSPRASYLDEVKLWIERLDRPSGTDTDPRLFVYAVQNGSAQHLATVLNGIYGGASSAASAAGGADVAPGLRPVTASTGGFAPSGATSSIASAGTGVGVGGGTGRGSPQAAGARGGGGGGVTSVSLSPNVRIVGDDLNNSVIIYAPPADFRKIEATLRRLDSPATQVLIEATIVEVTLADELQYGLQWYFTDSPRNGLTGTGQLNLNSQGGIGPIQPGLSYTLTNSIGQVRAVLNALADRSLINVISSPSLMVLDNHTATISVGDQQPIRSSETVTAGGNVTTSIQYKDTGVLLTVTPSVNSGDVVSMTISQAVTDVGSIDTATGQRAFLQRQVASRVAIKSGDALVLGGLIRDNSTGGSSGIPFLSRIPVVGALFGTKTQSSRRTELLIVITPRVIRTLQDAHEVSREMRERMRGLKTLVDEQRALLPPGFGDSSQAVQPTLLPPTSAEPSKK